jgi:putative acetyltransferase
MSIREEQGRDKDVVFELNTSAFNSPAEAKLVDALRAQATPIISLVSIDDAGATDSDRRVVGHIMFSPVTLAGHPELTLMGLAPMSVAPECQRQGLGSALVREGLERCREINCGAIVVLGHPEYYPRFGFVPASKFEIDSEYDVPDEVFMAQELVPGVLRGKTGRIKYHPVFGDL